MNYPSQSVIYINRCLNYIIYKYSQHYKIIILQNFILSFVKMTLNLSDIAANEINKKEISEDLKSFLIKKMENNAKKITEKIIEEMNTKFEELSTKIETIDNKTEAAESLSKQNQNNISNLTSESTALQEKLAGQVKKIHELDENIKDQINRNSRDALGIRGKKEGKSRENME